MKGEVTLYAGAPAARPRVREVAVLLRDLMAWRAAGGGADTTDLPQWLRTRFSDEMPMDQKRRWLAEWRSASPDRQAELEKSRGWELRGWLHWFSAQNEFWSIDQVVVHPDGGAVTVVLDQVDDDVPVGALTWLADAAGLGACWRRVGP